MDMDVNSPSLPYSPNNCYGFTLIELIVAITIAAILLGIGLPGMRHLIADTRLSGQVNEFIGQLQAARSEAVKTGQRVTLCKSSTGSSCDSSAEWHDGWITFVDKNENRQRDSVEPLVRIHQRLGNNITIDFGSFYSENYIVYYPSGRSPGNGTFTFCGPRGADYARALIFYRGRIRTDDSRPDGSALSCG